MPATTPQGPLGVHSPEFCPSEDCRAHRTSQPNTRRSRSLVPCTKCGGPRTVPNLRGYVRGVGGHQSVCEDCKPRTNRAPSFLSRAYRQAMGAQA